MVTFNTILQSAYDGLANKDVRQKIHLDFNYAVAGAVFAASAIYVEGKTTGAVTVLLRVSGFGEKLSYLSKNSRICRGIAARSSADRTLIDTYNLVQIFRSIHSVAITFRQSCAHYFIGKSRIKNLIDKT